MIATLWRVAGQSITAPFPKLTHAVAMERYGSDRPDTRYGLEIQDATNVFGASEFGIAKQAIAAGGRVRGIVVPHGAALSRKQVDEIEAEAKSAGALGLLRVKFVNGQLEGPVAKYLTAENVAQLAMHDGDLALFVAGPYRISSSVFDRVRQDVARRLKMIPEQAVCCLWVVGFPV